jgi:hypothetical protein
MCCYIGVLLFPGVNVGDAIYGEIRVCATLLSVDNCRGKGKDARLIFGNPQQVF